MSVSTQRGKDDSKEVVLCVHCGDFTTRKDNLARHTKNQHPGLQPKWKRIVKQTTRLTDFFANAYKGPGESSDCGNQIQNAELEDSEETCEAVYTVNDNAIEVTEDLLKRAADTNEDRGNSKRHKTMPDCLGTEQQPSSSNAMQLHEVKQVGLETLEKVTLIQNMLEKITNVNDSMKNRSRQESSDNDDIDNQIELFKTNLNKCKDLESTEQFLEGNGYLNCSENGFFACKLCYGNSNPPSIPAPSTPGIIQYSRTDIILETNNNQQKQSRGLLNFKKSVRRHVEETKTHRENLEEIRNAKIKEAERKLRSHEVGLNIFRLRYYQIKHGLSYLSFEEMILMAQMNKTDVGDVNHSRKFAAKIDKNLSAVMMEDIKDALETKLEATGHLRPLGFSMDKMTPNKQTRQIHAMITPVPENPLSEDLIVPIMMSVPAVTQGDAPGLAKMSKRVFNEAGAKDSQLEGLGWDGQYVKMRVFNKLLEIMERHPEMDKNKLSMWITQRWEPAHNIELATKDVKELGVFDWFNNHIKIVKDATEVLNAGKGLQQTIEASEELSLKFRKLRSLSTTRFCAYFESSLSSFEKSFDIIIRALRTRSESDEKKVRDIASDLLKKILNKQFLATHLGLMDVYRTLGSYSSMLQKVEQFPWEVTEKLEAVVKHLTDMSKLSLVDSNNEPTVDNIDKEAWPKVKESLNKVLMDEYIISVTDLFHEQRRGRSLSDIGCQNILKTLENRLTSLCKNLADRIEERALKNEECPIPDVIKLSGECLDLNKLTQKAVNTDTEISEEIRQEAEDFNKRTAVKMSKLMLMAGYTETKREEILKEYNTFKARFFEIVTDDKNELTKKFGHILFEEHKCAENCSKPCQLKGKPVEPKVIKPMKFLHLFLKERTLFTGIEEFLHLFLRCTMKTHAEGVAESMGNLIDIHCDKRRGRMNVDNVGSEAQIDWNGPPLHLADELGGKTLDKIFGGRSKWHFVTRDNKKDSMITRKLKQEKSLVPFWHDSISSAE